MTQDSLVTDDPNTTTILHDKFVNNDKKCYYYFLYCMIHDTIVIDD